MDYIHHDQVGFIPRIVGHKSISASHHINRINTLHKAGREGISLNTFKAMGPAGDITRSGERPEAFPEIRTRRGCPFLLFSSGGSPRHGDQTENKRIRKEEA